MSNFIKHLSISKSERRWLINWATAIMFITSLPYLYGWFLSTDHMQFSGFILGLEDANSYLAKMRMGAEGGWLFHLAYTPEPHPGAYLFGFHLLLGKIARLLSLSPVLVYHMTRIIFGIGLLLTLYGFMAYFLPSIPERKLAFLLAALGSGLGWLLILLQLTPTLGLPLDTYVPEGFIFLVLLHLPHLALVESLLFWAILLTQHGWQTNTWPPVIWAGLALLVMSWIAAFYIVVFAAVWGAVWVVLWPGRRPVRSLFIKIAAAVLISSPLLVYNAYVFSMNPILKIWSQQNIILSPQPWHYALAYGFLIIPALYGGRLLMAHDSHHRYQPLILIVWCLIFPILVYIPFNLQRRLVVGVQVPLAMLAAGAMCHLMARYISPGKQTLARAGIILFFSLTNIFLLTGGFASVLWRQPPIFRPQTQLKAMQWLAQRANDEVILAVYETGNALPAFANVRAFVGHGPETVNSEEKRELAQTFFRETTDDNWRLALLKKFKIRYLYYGPNEKATGNFAPAGAPYLRELYQNEEVQIFEVNLP